MFNMTVFAHALLFAVTAILIVLFYLMVTPNYLKSTDCDADSCRQQQTQNRAFNARYAHILHRE